MNEKKGIWCIQAKNYDTHTYTRMKNISVQQVAFSSIPSAPISLSNCLLLDCSHFCPPTVCHPRHSALLLLAASPPFDSQTKTRKTQMPRWGWMNGIQEVRNVHPTVTMPSINAPKLRKPFANLTLSLKQIWKRTLTQSGRWKQDKHRTGKTVYVYNNRRGFRAEVGRGFKSQPIKRANA